MICTMKTLCVLLVYAVSLWDLCGAEIRDNGFNISVPLPHEYEDMKSVPTLKNELIAVGRWNEQKSGLVRLLSISDLGGTIGREDLSKVVPAKQGVNVIKVKWKTFDIDTFRIEEKGEDQSWVTLNAQVPTVPRAIQIRIFGPASDEPELLGLLNSTLAGLESKTNWLTTVERVNHGLDGLIRLIITIAVIGLILRYFMKKK